MHNGRRKTDWIVFNECSPNIRERTPWNYRQWLRKFIPYPVSVNSIMLNCICIVSFNMLFIAVVKMASVRNDASVSDPVKCTLIINENDSKRALYYLRDFWCHCWQLRNTLYFKLYRRKSRSVLWCLPRKFQSDSPFQSDAKWKLLKMKVNIAASWRKYVYFKPTWNC